MTRFCAVVFLSLLTVAASASAFSHRAAMSNGGYCDTPESKEELRCKEEWKKKEARDAADAKTHQDNGDEEVKTSSQNTSSTYPKPPRN